MADLYARLATRESTCRASEKGVISMAYLKRRRTEKTVRRWKKSSTSRADRSRAFLDSKEGGRTRQADSRKPKIRNELQSARAACFCQLLGGQAMATASLKGK